MPASYSTRSLAWHAQDNPGTEPDVSMVRTDTFLTYSDLLDDTRQRYKDFLKATYEPSGEK